MNRAALALGLTLAACGGDDAPGVEPERCEVPAGDGPAFELGGPMCDRLSSYRLFDDLAAQDPADGLVPYDLNSALFSDYTTKYRFLYVPDGEAMTWHDVDAFEMPVGTIIVKTFAYLDDRREPDGGRDLLETRLLLRQADGWEAAAYLWNDDETEAELAVAGATLAATWIHDDGEPRDNAWVVPNKNQCKGCHGEHDEVISPLGPKARHLNRDGQLEAMIAAGRLSGAPDDPGGWPALPAFDDEAAGTVEERARAWLEINCAHCHNPTGAARTSGLDLRVSQVEPVEYGVCKFPIAAGTGSGGRPYGIVPGMPDQSILQYRIDSTDPEVRMPELGRNLVDEEGAALVREWITGLTGDCSAAR